jgi:imidazolonepropionase-like amidohydrolase
MKTYVRCGTLFTGLTDAVEQGRTVVIEDGKIRRIVPTSDIQSASDGTLLDYSDCFVMPGLIDVHTHLAYGNAKTEEDIDIYAPLEFRAVRALYFAQQVLAAGYTSIGAPGSSGFVSSAVRDAVDAGLFDGPRITSAGPYITSRQGLTDWYPTWIGAPSTSIGRLVHSRDEAIEEIRRQVKDRVDSVKLALDGIQLRPNGEIIAAFTEDETKAMVDEIHRLGKIAIAHARGREAALYAGKAGVDLIFHCSYMDDEGLDWILKNNCKISPTLTLLKNSIDFAQTTDPFVRRGRLDAYKREWDTAIEVLSKAKKAGVKMPTGTDSGFAVTPYGEWHAREILLYTEYLGFTPAEALRSATVDSAVVSRPADAVGAIAPGMRGDVIAIKGNPLEKPAILMDREALAAVILGGKKIERQEKRTFSPLRVSDFAMSAWSDIYTQDRVAELTATGAIQ